MAKATTYANDILDFGFNGAASGTLTIATYTGPLKVKFLSTLSTAGTAGTEWSTSGGYTQTAGGSVGGVSLSGNFTTPAASASKANTAAVTVTNAPAGTWADNEIVDSTAGTNKRMNFKGTPSLAKTVNAGDTCTIAIGSLTGSET
jgi:hypothetical protein